MPNIPVEPNPNMPNIPVVHNPNIENIPFAQNQFIQSPYTFQHASSIPGPQKPLILPDIQQRSDQSNQTLEYGHDYNEKHNSFKRGKN